MRYKIFFDILLSDFLFEGICHSVFKVNIFACFCRFFASQIT